MSDTLSKPLNTQMPPFDEYADEWLQAEQILGGRFVLSTDIDTLRVQFAALFQNLKEKLPPPSDAVITNDVQLPDGGPLVRIYTPKVLEGKRNSPIGLYIHAGGFVAGDIENEDHIVRDIAERVPIVLVSPSYRLAPENPFPAGLDDCIAAYKWMLQSASSLSCSPKRAIIMGGSAGGNLTGGVALSIIDKEPDLAPKGVVIACASTIHPDVIPEKYRSLWNPERLADAAMLNREAMMPCMDAYGANPTEPLWSLLLHPNLCKLPKTWLVQPTKDPTHDEMAMFYAELRHLGVDVEMESCAGYPHFFWMLPFLTKSQELMGKWASKVREMVE